MARRNRVQTYDCRRCELFERIGEVCPMERGKKYYWQYCRSFKPKESELEAEVYLTEWLS